MSIQVVRFEKVKTAVDVVGLEKHDRRERRYSNSNPDIDFGRTERNYFLLDKEMSVNEKIDRRISEGYTGGKKIRKDAVRAFSAIFSSDGEFFKDMPVNKQHDFFNDCLEWCNKRYGKENIVSAVVHMDEATPHLHVMGVPLTTDGGYSYKAVFGGRLDYQKLQDDFHEQVGSKWGLERGNRANLDDPDEKITEHRDLKRYKAETRREIAKLNTERNKALNQAQKTQNALTNLSNQNNILNAKIKDMESKYGEYRKLTIDIETNVKDIGKQNSLTKNYTLTADEYSRLTESAKTVVTYCKRYKNSLR